MLFLRHNPKIKGFNVSYWFFFLEKRQCLVVYILNKTQMTKETLYISQHDSAVSWFYTVDGEEDIQSGGFSLLLVLLFLWDKSRELFWSDRVKFLWFYFHLVVRICWFFCIFTKDVVLSRFLGGEVASFAFGLPGLSASISFTGSVMVT